MIDTVIGKTYTVSELIDILKEFPQDMPIVTDGYNGIDNIDIHTWVDSNYPYNLPNTHFVVII